MHNFVAKLPPSAILTQIPHTFLMEPTLLRSVGEAGPESLGEGNCTNMQSIAPFPPIFRTQQDLKVTYAGPIFLAPGRQRKFEFSS